MAKIIKAPVLVLSIVILALATYILGWSQMFTVEKIIIDSKDKKIVNDVMDKITKQPAVVEIGQPLARVDRREIATRLREMLWVENIKLERRLLSGELHISIIARDPIGRLIPRDSTNVNSIGFIDQDLENFYLPTEAVARALAAGEWSEMPEISIQNDSRELRSDISQLIKTLQGKSLKVERVNAKDQISISTKLVNQGRRLDISWGSVKDLELKIEIMNRLLELKANKSVKNLNLSNPTSPIVSR
ncbi:MAG: cell division protein FtsQ/DivIB [Candidatus Nanopelagicaceae bacterium]